MIGSRRAPRAGWPAARHARDQGRHLPPEAPLPAPALPCIGNTNACSDLGCSASTSPVATAAPRGNRTWMSAFRSTSPAPSASRTRSWGVMTARIQAPSGRMDRTWTRVRSAGAESGFSRSIPSARTATSTRVASAKPAAATGPTGVATRPSRTVPSYRLTGPEQSRREQVRGAGIDLVRRRVLHDSAVSHHHDPIPQQHRLLGVVGHEHGRRVAAGKQAHGLHPHLVTQVLVEGGKRLVEEHDPGPRRERAKERHPLLLSAGEGVRIAVRKVAHAEVPEGTAGLRLPPRDPASGEPVADVLEHGQVGEQGVVLEYEPDPARFGSDPTMAAGRSHGPAPRCRCAPPAGLRAPPRAEAACSCRSPTDRAGRRFPPGGPRGPPHRRRRPNRTDGKRLRTRGRTLLDAPRVGQPARWPGRERVMVRLMIATGRMPATTMVSAASAHSSRSSSEAYW